VVLLQLGGPDSLASVEPFLYNLFSDPDIIDLPLAFLFRKRLARLISSRRAPKVAEYYRTIGGRSPILPLTLRQARALEQALRPAMDARVVVAMRYWHPLTGEALRRVREAECDHVVLLPLYPQFSKTTTGSSLNEWNRCVAREGLPGVRVSTVREYFDHPLYVQALVENIARALQRVPEGEREGVHLVFSAHGTPVKLVRQGDPYQAQVIRTYEAVLARGAFGQPHTLCYQSRVGPQEWLAPSLIETVDRLAERGTGRLLVIPVSFVSDHSETLYEINMEVRRHAHEKGIRRYDMMPALHTNPSFIAALADLVRRAVAS
jgi:ferrochelatase